MTRHEYAIRVAFFCTGSCGAVANNGTKPAQPNQVKNNDQKKKSGEGIIRKITRKWETAGPVTALFPLSRIALYLLANRGEIDSRILNIRGGPYGGKRVFNVESIERWIERSPTKSALHIKRKKAKAGRMGAAAKHGRAK